MKYSIIKLRDVEDDALVGYVGYNLEDICGIASALTLGLLELSNDHFNPRIDFPYSSGDWAILKTED